VPSFTSRAGRSSDCLGYWDFIEYMTSNHCHSKYHSGVNIIICVVSALWRSSPLRSMAQSHPGMDINSSNSSPREASPVSLPTPIRLVSISLSSGMDMKEKTEDANDEEPKQEGGKSHGGAIPLQIDEAAAPSPSSKARAQPRPWWLSILFVTLSFIVIASVLVAIIMRYHEGILTGKGPGDFNASAINPLASLPYLLSFLSLLQRKTFEILVNHPKVFIWSRCSVHGRWDRACVWPLISHSLSLPPPLPPPVPFVAARWCQERQPWSIILNGCIIVGGMSCSQIILSASSASLSFSQLSLPSSQS